MKLIEIPNTAVNVKTQTEYDELMQIYEDGGWKWNKGQRPTENDVWHDEREETAVQVENNFRYARAAFYKIKNYKIIALEEFKKEQGMDYPKIFKDKRDDTFIKVRKVEGNDEYFVRTPYKASYERVKDSDEVVEVISRNELNVFYEEYTPIETIEVNGKKYNAKEVEERLSELKEIDG